MARKFEFKTNTLELDIAGHIFEVDPTNPRLIQEIQTFALEAQKKVEELSERRDYAKALEEVIQFCIDAIDSILGTGAAEKIFAGRKINFFDCLDVINFIVSEVNEFRQQKFQQYSPNRAMRRANKK